MDSKRVRYVRLNVVLVILLTMGLPCCRSVKPALENPSSGKSNDWNVAGTDFHEQVTWLLGFINPVRFQSPPHSEWYLKGYEDYQPDRKAIEGLKAEGNDDLTIKIVLGTWCPDSRREVPRFVKVLNQWGFPADKVTFIGTDSFKVAPVGGYEGLGIEWVPPSIIYTNKVEAGRIIENPVTSLEQDILNILTRNENIENK